jgi:hypothetical protein
LDRKGEGIRILLDVVDFLLGIINNESIETLLQNVGAVH